MLNSAENAVVNGLIANSFYTVNIYLTMLTQMEDIL